jgi:hypothetical protein
MTRSLNKFSAHLSNEKINLLEGRHERGTRKAAKRALTRARRRFDREVARDAR